MTRAAFSITELSRATGIGRHAIYNEIERGCLAAQKGPGGSWGKEQVWLIEWLEVERWKAAYLADERRKEGRRDGDHNAHKGQLLAPKAKQ